MPPPLRRPLLRVVIMHMIKVSQDLSRPSPSTSANGSTSTCLGDKLLTRLSSELLQPLAFEIQNSFIFNVALALGSKRSPIGNSKIENILKMKFKVNKVIQITISVRIDFHDEVILQK